jgi:hypothetical protein
MQSIECQASLVNFLESISNILQIQIQYTNSSDDSPIFIGFEYL